jgi:hypothetical protein
MSLFILLLFLTVVNHLLPDLTYRNRTVVYIYIGYIYILYKYKYKINQTFSLLCSCYVNEADALVLSSNQMISLLLKT